MKVQDAMRTELIEMLNGGEVTSARLYDVATRAEVMADYLAEVEPLPRITPVPVTTPVPAPMPLPPEEYTHPRYIDHFPSPSPTPAPIVKMPEVTTPVTFVPEAPRPPEAATNEPRATDTEDKRGLPF